MEITKKYLVEQIERLEKIIKEGTNYLFTKRLSEVSYKLFGNSYMYSRFKKDLLLEYLEELVKEGFELGLLDSNFTY